MAQLSLFRSLVYHKCHLLGRAFHPWRRQNRTHPNNPHHPPTSSHPHLAPFSANLTLGNPFLSSFLFPIVLHFLLYSSLGPISNILCIHLSMAEWLESPRNALEIPMVLIQNWFLFCDNTKSGPDTSSCFSLFLILHVSNMAIIS